MEIETSRFVFVFTLFRTAHFAQKQRHLAIIVCCSMFIPLESWCHEIHINLLLLLSGLVLLWKL